MSRSENTTLQEFIFELDQISSRIGSTGNAGRDFQEVLAELNRWKDRATITLESEFSQSAAEDIRNAADFRLVSFGDFDTLAVEVQRHRRALAKLAQRTAPKGMEKPITEIMPPPSSPPRPDPHSTGQNKGSIRDAENGRSDENNSLTKLGKVASKRADNGNKGTSGDDLLMKLGKIAGIGGIGVGTFLILFRKLAFPTLPVNLAALFMFLCYGIAVLGLIIWASQSTKRRSLPLLLLVAALALAFFGWSSLRPGFGQSGSAYNVHVAVYSPDDSPVDHAQVGSSLGGETKEVSGGAEIALPLSTATKGQQLTVTAVVPKLGWKGTADLKLADDYSPTLKVFLKGAGELPVRGTVFNESGTSVPNAQVTIIGFGEEAVSTGALGQFVLPSHAHKSDKIHLHAELANLVADKEDYEVGSRPAELVLRVRGEDIRSSHRGMRPKPQAHLTHDAVIDRVLINLATLKEGARPPTEAQLAEKLTPLFTRPAFYGIREEDWRYFLYPLCRTRLLLEEYVDQFKSKPEVGKDITQAIDKMVVLQNEVARLYGPTFSITQHIDRYINDKNAFIDNLPPVVVDPKPEYFDARDQEIRDVRNLLRAAGFPLK